MLAQQHLYFSQSFFTAVIPVLGTLIVGRFGINHYKATKSPLNAIPTIGHSGILLSYLTAMKWMARGADLLQEGYIKFHGRPFKVATPTRWIVVLSGKKYVDDLCRASEDILSFNEPAIETTQGDYTFGPRLHVHPHHINTIRSSVTRNISGKFEDISDEALAALDDYIPSSQEWRSIPAYETLLHIVCRTTNRYLVGLPLCRNSDYLFISEQFTVDVSVTSQKINSFPDILKPIAGKIFGAQVKERIKAAYDILAPFIEDRLERFTRFGLDRDGLENDVFTWLLESATQDYHYSVEDIVRRILVINFTSIHTTAVGLIQGIYDLAVHPEYVQEMRDEAERVIDEGGWSKASLHKMHKIDSFLKESFRLNGGANLLMIRKTIKDWMLSDGTLIPPDTYVGVAVDAMNKSEASFQDAQTFNGFRFVAMNDGRESLDSAKQHLVCLSPEYIVFGNGRHACPGRFLGVNNIKVMFIHILLNYDVQLENGSLEHPPNTYFAASTIPNQEAKLMFRKRISS
ncbi:hypothetical protein D9756_008944 [Leucocoprinus leucothites]|uniref:Cytochrome P450 n=1 Tax=Leucocoprinus leucothites TaxID=201217 RepID=A0A8H5FUQ2_9AGAR|nr:hypothetical protein D9756_008944 [Leucoagaricus leucothites]